MVLNDWENAEELQSLRRFSKFILGVLTLLLCFSIVPFAAAETWIEESWTDCPQADAWGGGGSDSSGTHYISCGDGPILVYGSEGELLAGISHGAGAVHDVASNADGSHLYLARGQSPPVRMTRQINGSYTVDSQATWSLAKYPFDEMDAPKMATPLGRAIDTDASGNVYLSDGGWVNHVPHDPTTWWQNHNRILKYSAAGTYITQFGRHQQGSWALGEFHGSIHGIAVSADGSTVYAADQNGGRIQKFERQGDSYIAQSSFGALQSDPPNPDGTRGSCPASSDPLSLKMASPYDVALASDGSLFGLSTTCRQVIKVGSGGQLLHRSSWDSGSLPHSFAISPDGCRVYVNQARLKFRRSGCASSPPSPLPETRISSGPSGSTASTSARFSFSSPDSVFGYECRLDQGGWETCSSPLSFGDLEVGGHLFEVRSQNEFGVDPTPAARGWRVIEGGNGDGVDPVRCKAARKSLRLARGHVRKATLNLARARGAKPRARAKEKLKKARKAVRRAEVSVRKSCS
jgi:hypothetical protein